MNHSIKTWYPKETENFQSEIIKYQDKLYKIENKRIIENEDLSFAVILTKNKINKAL